MALSQGWAPLFVLACVWGAAAQGDAEWKPAASNAGLDPQRLQAYNHTHYWQLAEEPVIGTMVLIHGCGPGARAFFPYNPVKCPECQGLPEYLSQTKQALAAGYNVLALQANDEGSGCWSSSTAGGRIDDRPDVVATVRQFIQDHDATKLPVYCQGYSSGGTMCLKLPAYIEGSGDRVRLDGIVPVDVAPRGGFNAEAADGTSLRAGLDFPPAIWVVQDLGKARTRAPGQVDFLNSNGVPAAMIVSYPRQVPPSFFQDRIPGVTKYQSEALVGVMRKVGALNATDYLVPGVWPLDAAVAELPWLAADARLQAAVATQLRLAAGDHENLGEFTTAALAWLEAGGKADAAELVKELVSPQPGLITIDRRAAGAAAPAPSPAA